jgi:hypothetical protein
MNTDRQWSLAAAKGDIRTEAALEHCRNLNATVHAWRDRDPDLLRALAYGDLRWPDDDRRTEPLKFEVEVDEETQRAYDALPKPGPVVVRVADVEPERVRWLWPARIPLSKLTVLDGDPAVGKSTLMVDITARVTTGTPWPDDGPDRRSPASVVWMTAEDGIADTLRPRLEAAGADVGRVVVLDAIRSLSDDGTATHDRPPELPGDIGHLETVIRANNAELVIVDVLMAFLSGRVDGHKDQDVRGALSQVAKLAETTGAAIVFLRHMNKSGGANALYRGGGSIGIIGQARAGMLAGLDPDDETLTRRVLAQSKSNLAALPGSLAYRLVEDEEWDCARVQWDGPTNHLAGDLVALPGLADDRDDACDALRTILADGDVWAKQAFDAMADAGFSKDQAKRAKSKLKVTTHKVGGRGDTDQGWKWHLPTATTNGEQQMEGRFEGSEGSTSQTPLPSAPFQLGLTESEQWEWADGGLLTQWAAESPIYAQRINPGKLGPLPEGGW